MDNLALIVFMTVSGFVVSSIFGTVRELLLGQPAGFRNGYIQSINLVSAFFTVLFAGPFMAWRDMEKWCSETKPKIGQILTIIAFICTWSLLIGLCIMDLALKISAW